MYVQVGLGRRVNLQKVSEGKMFFGELDVGLFALQPHRFLITPVTCTGFLAVSSYREGLTISQLLGEPIEHYEQGPYESKCIDLNWLSSSAWK